MNCAKLTVSLFSVLVLMSLGSSALAQDWPQYRGPNRDDKVAGFAAPKTWPQEFHQKWKATVGQADATPALVGGKLYVFARKDDNESIQCLDADTGKEIWSDKYEVLKLSGGPAQHSGPRSSPTVADGKVVTFGVRGTLSCYNAVDGKMLWRKDDIKGAPQFFTAASPLIVNGLCIAQLGGKADGVIIAYDLSTGVEKWRWTGDGTAYASPVLMTIGDTKLIVAQTDKRVVAVNLADGKLAWETPFEGKGMGGNNTATPIIDGQTIIYTGGGRGTVAVELTKQGDTFTGKQLWANTEFSPRFATPVLKNGLLYGESDKAGFYCINAKTGATAWSEPTSRGGFGSILDAGPVLVALTPKSQLIVFQPSDKAYTEVASIKVADTATYSQPVLAGNRLYVEDQDSVTAWTVN